MNPIKRNLVPFMVQLESQSLFDPDVDRLSLDGPRGEAPARNCPQHALFIDPFWRCFDNLYIFNIARPVDGIYDIHPSLNSPSFCASGIDRRIPDQRQEGVVYLVRSIE